MSRVFTHLVVPLTCWLTPCYEVFSLRGQFWTMLAALRSSPTAASISISISMFGTYTLLALASFGTYTAVTMTTYTFQVKCLKSIDSISAPAVPCVDAALTGCCLAFLSFRVLLTGRRSFLEDLGHRTRAESPDEDFALQSESLPHKQSRVDARRASLLAG